MDDQAYGDIYRTHKHRLVSFAHGILGDRHLAEDVAQETLLKAAIKLPPGMSNLWPWLRKVARNHCLDIIKSRRETSVASLLELVGAESAGSRAERLDAIRAVERAIGELPAIHQETLRLAYWEELSNEEIAKRQGITKASVRDRLHYARKLLHAKLRSLKDLGWIILPGLSGKKALLQRALRRAIRVAVVSTVSVATVAVVVPQTSFVAEAEEGRRAPVAPGHQVAPANQISIIGSDFSKHASDVSGLHSANYRQQVSDPVSIPQGPDTPAGNGRGTIGPLTIHCDPSTNGPAASLVCATFFPPKHP